MLGPGLQLTRWRGEESYPTKGRRTPQNQQNDQLRKGKSDVTASQSPLIGLGDPPKAVIAQEIDPVVSPLSNLERFLESITPFVPAQYLSKTTMRSWKTCDVQYYPYFVLDDLWESFKEWSVYGAGVPLILDDNDSVVQYYVPYLSGIQIYVDSMNSSTKCRQPGEDSDSDFRDSSSDNSSDCELERSPTSLIAQHNHHGLENDIRLRMDRLSLRDLSLADQADISSDESESGNSRGRLLFEYLECDRPYSREPLADKISVLASRFPELKTLRSCDLLPSSWVSVAWYPIYRIPTGPTLRDLDACFLTYHSLHTRLGGTQSTQTPVVTYPSETDEDRKISLPVFGLASYKFKGALWTPNGGFDRQLASSLFQTADDLLTTLKVNHPDFIFFCRRR